jgi:hypothetical protein
MIFLQKVEHTDKELIVFVVTEIDEDGEDGRQFHVMFGHGIDLVGKDFRHQPVGRLTMPVSGLVEFGGPCRSMA